MSRRSKKRRPKETAVKTAGGDPSAAAPGAPGVKSESQPVANGPARKPSRRNWEVAGICALLVTVVFVVFGQTMRHGFVNFDDNQYIFENPIVSQGLSLAGLGWAFTHVVSTNWHPLTLIVHMLDCQIYGLWAGGHHLTNVILHAACVVLLFLLLLEMTGPCGAADLWLPCSPFIRFGSSRWHGCRSSRMY
jgi:hypothetical protein